MTTQLSRAMYHKDFVTALLEKASESTNWSDKQAASLLVLLADVLGDIGENNNAAIRIAAREAFIQLSRRASSTLAGARFLGIPIRRKSAATTRVKFTNGSTDPVTYDQHTAVSVSGKAGYLRTTLALNPGETKDFDVVIGEVVEETFEITEQRDLQTFSLTAGDFTIDSYDVWTTDPAGNTFPYTVIDQAFTRAAAGDYVVTDFTDEQGAVSLLFGGRFFGRALDRGHVLHARYVTCGGSADNNDAVGLVCSLLDNRQIAGRTVEPITGGSDELPIEYYRQFGPVLHLSRRQLSRPDEWRAFMLAQPGIADCSILSQRDIAPNDPSFQKVIRICALPYHGETLGGVNPNPRSAQWDRLIDKIALYRPLHIIQTWNPTRLMVQVVVEVIVHSWYNGDLREVEDRCRNEITKLFRPRPGILGRTLAIDDISDACKYAKGVRINHIDYVRVLGPETDLTPSSKLEYIALRSLRVTATYSKRGGTNAFI